MFSIFNKIYYGNIKITLSDRRQSILVQVMYGKGIVVSTTNRLLSFIFIEKM